MRSIGIHLRLMTTLTDVAQKAIRLGVDTFQCFFVVQDTATLIRPTEDDIQQFRQLREKHFKQVFAHASYWINLSSVTHSRHRALEQELELARLYGFTHLILHPGSAKGGKRSEGIDALARGLNRIHKEEHNLTIVLENIAFAKQSVGGDINDFKLVLDRLNHPDKVKFCIDTAHAHSYGYDIITPEGQDAFIELLRDVIGIERIALIHLNETKEPKGSRADRHQLLGDGLIGNEALKRFVLHPQLAQIPILLEPPQVAEDREKELIDLIRGWHT